MPNGWIVQTTSGETTSYAFAWYVPVVASVFLVAVFALGRWAAKRPDEAWHKRLRGHLLQVIGIVGVTTIVPTLALRTVTVGDDYFHFDLGRLFGERHRRVDFWDVERVEIDIKASDTARGLKRRYSRFTFLLRTGTAEEIVFGDELLQASEPELLRRLRQRGIPVRDERG